MTCFVTSKISFVKNEILLLNIIMKIQNLFFDQKWSECPVKHFVLGLGRPRKFEDGKFRGRI